MIPIEMHEPTPEFRACWLAAGRHINQQAEFPSLAWIAADLQPPFLVHLSFRYLNQLFFLRIDPRHPKIETLGNVGGLMRVSAACKGYAWNLPMVASAGGEWRPLLPGWGLEDAVTKARLDPPALANEVPIPITDWELHDFGVQIVRDALAESGKTVIASQGDPEVDPSIWFETSQGLACVVVRSVRWPRQSAEKPMNWAAIAAECSSISRQGYFASVVASADEAGARGALIRGRALNARYSGLIPA